MPKHEPGSVDDTLNRLAKAGYEFERTVDGSVVLGSVCLSAAEVELLSPMGLADLADTFGVPQNYRPSLFERIENGFFDKVAKLGL